MSTSPYPHDAVPPPAGAMLQVYRKPSIAGVTAAFNIKLDGTDLGRVKPGEAVRYPIAPGKHRLQVVIWGNMGSKAALFTAHPGETVYFTSTAPLMAVLHPIELVQDDGSPAAAAALASPGGAGGSIGTRTGAGPGMAAASAAPWEQRPDGGPWEQRSVGGAATGGGRSGAAGTGAPSEPRLGAVR